MTIRARHDEAAGTPVEFSIEQVEAAINRYCRSHQPVAAADHFVMDDSLGRMAHVYGEMIAQHRNVVDLSGLDGAVRALFLEWAAP
ncbi:DUF3717 domain-containing protein [Burkholderia vietnamiensis]|jgi:hypothetical protein|uniref:DUF3717 domain-containing protein n=1 Tax=Burkholderia cepacia complex TaxID=87882 RepID=UPI00158E2548|nr:DUF3717 domain-containing protein [Burkholderia vietnamiensis]